MNLKYDYRHYYCTLCKISYQKPYVRNHTRKIFKRWATTKWTISPGYLMKEIKRVVLKKYQQDYREKKTKLYLLFQLCPFSACQVSNELKKKMFLSIKIFNLFSNNLIPKMKWVVLEKLEFDCREKSKLKALFYAFTACHVVDASL